MLETVHHKYAALLLGLNIKSAVLMCIKQKNLKQD